MRCLTFADALALRGGNCTFVCAEAPDALTTRIIEQGHRLLRIDPAPEGGEEEGWDLRPHSVEAQAADAARTLDALDSPQDWIVVDHYRLGAEYERRLRSGATRILAFDDLANRPHDCEILLDQTYGRPTRDYENLVPGGARLLIGPHYAPLRPEFAAARAAALPRRDRPRVERLLVTLGSTDVAGITAKVLERVLTIAGDFGIDVVLGQEAPSLNFVRSAAAADCRVRLHLDSRNMAEIMVSADLAIGAAGTTSWERCCLGLPAIALVLAPNQRLIAEQLSAAGAHLLLDGGDIGRLPSLLTDLLADRELRSAMARRASEITDGMGAERLCDVVLEQEAGH